MKKPLIGITASHDLRTGDLRMAPSYQSAIQKSGGIPLILPLALEEEECRRLAETLDGFLFTGGPDVHPFLFGEDTMEGCGDRSPLRDQTELSLFSAVYQQKKPVLGICRGAQLINIALGGDIYQDLASQLPGRLPIAHRQPFHLSNPSHRVSLEPDSLLAKISGAETIEVNSAHHQAIRKTAAPLSVSGRTADSVIEAVEQRDYPFLIGVQWHPEMLADTYSHASRLFEAFVCTCRPSS